MRAGAQDDLMSSCRSAHSFATTPRTARTRPKVASSATASMRDAAGRSPSPSSMASARVLSAERSKMVDKARIHSSVTALEVGERHG
eukprot:5507225-Prymnesium_polylepis.1